jgi:hypothetical protein
VVEVRGRSHAGQSGSLVVLGLVLVASFGSANAGPFDGAPVSASVSLFDDDGDHPLFPGTQPLVPGRTRSACMSVGAAGAAPGDAVYVSATGVGGALADYLQLTVELGSGGSYGDCTAFTGAQVWSGSLSDLAAASTGSGIPTGWDPSAQPVRSFRVSATLADVPAASGLAAAAKFVWRLSQTPVTPSPSPTTPSPSPSSPSPTPTTPSPTPTTPSPTPTTPSPTATRPTPTVPPTTMPPVTTSTVSEPTTPDATGTDVPTTPASTEPQPDPVVPSSPPDPGEPSDGPTPVGPVDTGDDDPATPTRSPAVLPPGEHGGGGGGDAGGAKARTPKPDVVLGVPLAGLRQTARAATAAAVTVVRSPQYPLSALALAALFLLVQDAIDRRDPKLAVARVTQRDDRLPFPDLFPPGGYS